MGCGGAKNKPRKNQVKRTVLTDHQADIIGNNIPVNYVVSDEGTKTISRKDSNQNIGQESPKNDSNLNKPVRAENKRARNRAIMEGEVADQMFENIKKTQKSINDTTLESIQSSLTNHFFFRKLQPNELNEIIKQMFYCEIPAGEYVFKEGDQASSFFVIESGAFQVEIQGKIKKTLQKGEMFGELALLYNAPRSASVCSTEQSSMWGIGRSEFQKTISNMAESEYTNNRLFMESVTFFMSMTNEQQNVIARTLISVKYKKNQFIVNQGDQADSFYMIQQGTVSIYKDEKFVLSLSQGDSFGEQALFQQSQRLASVQADSEVVCLSLGRDDLTTILGQKVQQVIFENQQRRAYEDSALLKQLTRIQKEKLIREADIQNVSAGNIIFEVNTTPDKYVIMLEGQLQNDQKEVVCRQGQIFGDHLLPLDKQDTQFKEAIMAQSNGVIAQISHQKFHKAIGGDIETVIQKNKNSHEKKMAQLEKRADYSHVKLENLIFIKKLGSGQFGNVFLVQDQTSKDKEVYALKSVNKAMVVSQKLEKYLISEQKILEHINFPFIMPFYRTFRDEISLYFLVKNISGMELFDVIRDIGLLSTYDSQFYVGTMILCLEYLHKQNIVYRDLKPENIMVGEDGIMYMIDMGTAQFLNKTKVPGRTYTIIGTPHYMAPEIIQGKGYSYSIDLWSVGVCLYEFMCGGIPFAQDASDPFQIYQEIIKQNVKYPNFFKDKKAKKLIEQLFNLVPEQRMGGSFASLQSHIWFDNFDWDKLYNKELKPPFPPPKNKVTQKDEIEKFAKKGIPIIDEIQQQNAAAGNNKVASQKPADPNWDNEFQ